MDLGLALVNAVRGRPSQTPLLAPKPAPLSIEWTSAEARALKQLEPSTRAHVMDVVMWSRSQGIPARLSTQSVVYSDKDMTKFYEEGKSAIAPGKLSWHSVGRAYHLVIKIPGTNRDDNDGYARVGAYVRSKGGEWLGDRVIMTPKGPIVDTAHFEYHPGMEIGTYRKSPVAQVEYKKAQERASKYA